MDATTQKNGLYLEDPLEKLRGFFRTYWQCISKNELIQAQDIWDKTIVVELESMEQLHPDISRESIQTVLFEEKRRLQDYTFLVNSIVEKLAAHLDQKLLNLNESPADRAFMPSTTTHRKEGSFTAKATNTIQTSNTSKSFTTHGLDLTSMIDSMIEDEKLLNR